MMLLCFSGPGDFIRHMPQLDLEEFWSIGPIPKNYLVGPEISFHDITVEAPLHFNKPEIDFN